MVKKLMLLAAALGLALGAAAQDPESAYAGIFRGKLPGIYPYKYNGTYFWDRKEFQTGDILYNGKLYRDILINVDAVQHELQVRLRKISKRNLQKRLKTAPGTGSTASASPAATTSWKSTPRVTRDASRPSPKGLPRTGSRCIRSLLPSK